MKKTKKLAAAALTAAIACAVMLAGALLPAGRLAVPAVASLAMFAAYIECGRLYGLLSYGASAALALLLSPDKPAAALYAVFFGLYPSVKAAAEGLKSRAAEYAVKLAFFNAAFAALYFGVRLFADMNMGKILPVLLWVGGNAVFFVFDAGLSGLIAFYMARIHGK